MINSSLDPWDVCEFLRIDDIYLFVNKFYHKHFTNHEKLL